MDVGLKGLEWRQGDHPGGGGSLSVLPAETEKCRSAACFGGGVAVGVKGEAGIVMINQL